MKISFYIIVLIVRDCFDRTHKVSCRFEKIIFALDARALFLHDCDKLSCIFSCIILARYHMIFLVQFGINKHLLIFSYETKCTRPTGSWNFVSLWKKFTLAYLFQIALEIMSLPIIINFCLMNCNISTTHFTAERQDLHAIAGNKQADSQNSTKSIWIYLQFDFPWYLKLTRGHFS